MVWFEIIAIIVICLAVAKAGHAWIRSHPVPRGCLEPVKMRRYFAMMTFLAKLDRLAKFFTGRSLFKALMKMRRKPPPPSISKKEAFIEGIRTVIYRPAESSNHCVRPAIVFYHGGAWMMGCPELEQGFLVDLIHDLGVVIYSVDYRLTPEHPFPAGFDDCYKVTEYILAHPKEFNIDPNKILIGGQSAGGNLAAAVGTKLRDQGLAKKIKGQLLIVPVTQAHDFETTSHKGNKYDTALSKDFSPWAKYALGHKYKDVLGSMTQNTHVPREKRDEFVKLCGDSPRLTKTVKKPTDVTAWRKLQPYLENPYFAPLVAKDLTGIAATVLVTAGQDVLRDDGLLYGERLRQSGVKVFSVHSESTFHGTLGIKDFAPLEYDRSYQMVLVQLKKLLE